MIFGFLGQAMGFSFFSECYHGPGPVLGWRAEHGRLTCVARGLQSSWIDRCYISSCNRNECYRREGQGEVDN
jgi:hypothetical protein